MKYLSLFSGIGGFELGIQKAYEDIKSGEQESIGAGSERNYLQQSGDSTHPSISREESKQEQRCGLGEWVCIGYSEIDKYAIQIYQKQFPQHKNYGDVTKINVSELPDFDLLVGGFPCQAFSIAGKRRGFDDTRGTLFFDIARILKEKRPRNFVLENVKGLLSHDGGATFKTIISTLTELGYCVEWQVLNAKNFGVPQNRERVFIVGHLGGIPKRKVFPIGKFNPKTVKRFQGDVSGKGYASQQDRVYYPDGIMGTLPHGRTESKVNIFVPVLTPDRPVKRQNGRRFKTDGEVAFTQTAQDRHGIFNGSRIRRLTPLECERLMGYPDGWTEYGMELKYLEGGWEEVETEISDTQRYKTLGNGIVSNVVAEVIKKIYE